MPANNVASGCSPEPGRDLLELVDSTGQTVGVLDKLAAHMSPGHLHRAFSVFLFDDEERLLLQRRVLGKYHSPGVWSKTCCGHPFPGEPPAGAAARRVEEELGIAPVGLAAAGTVRYALPAPKPGLIEREYNHVVVGRFRDDPRPDPAEVSDWTVATPGKPRDMRDRLDFSVWFPAELERVAATGRSADLHLDTWRWATPRLDVDSDKESRVDRGVGNGPRRLRHDVGEDGTDPATGSQRYGIRRDVPGHDRPLGRRPPQRPPPVGRVA